MTISVRDLPPLRHTIEIETPSGKRYRWAEDAPDANDVPSGLTGSSTMPGGFEQWTGSLPRRAGIDYADLDRLSTITDRAADGEIVGEYRLERAPRTSGDQMVISPAAVGWQAHLADDQGASAIIIDRDLGRWQGPSRQRILNLGTGRNTGTAAVQPDATTGSPALRFQITDAWASVLPTVESWYDAGEGNRIGRVRLSWTQAGNASFTGDAAWFLAVHADTDDVGTSDTTTGDLTAAASGTVDLNATGSSRRFAFIELVYTNAPAGAAGASYEAHITDVRVIGDHGLTIRGSTAADEGFLASDVAAYLISRFAPLLSFSTGTLGTIQASTFIIAQLAWTGLTDAGQMVRDVSRFGLEDWAVWEGKTFYWNARGARGRDWRARVAPSGLEETGPQIDRLWESVIVSYRDVDGSTRTVGPPGSGAGGESADLKDSDPENPANILGITRRALLQAGTLPAAAATEIGRRFLIEQKALDTSGRARLTGHVMDSHGVLYPYSHVRAGDTITFVDAADPSARRIVRAEHSRSDRAVSVDLDAPPEGLQALLERLGVTLAPLGV